MNSDLRKNKKATLIIIIAIMSLAAANNGAGYCGNVVLPNKLAAMNATEYYSLCAAISSLGTMVLLPALGVLSNRFGAGRVTLTGMISQVILRVIAMAITNPILFTAVWFFNGVSNAMYITAPYVLLAEIVPDDERVKYYGFVAAMNAMGTLLCPLLAGIFVDSGNMMLAFLSYAVFVILPVIVLSTIYPHKTGKNDKKFDFAGIVLMGIAVGCLVILLSLGGKFFDFNSVVTYALLACSIGSFLLMIKVEKKSDNPSVPIFLFKRKRFRLCFICALFYVAYSICPGAYLLMYVQSVMHQSSTLASTVTMPQTIIQAIVGIFIGSFVGKDFVKRFKPTAAIAVSTLVIALFILSTLSPEASIVKVYAATGMAGFGCAFTQSCIAPYFQTELEPHEYPAAQGMFTFACSGGASIIMAVTGMFINLGFDYNKVFLLCSCLCLVALFLFIFGVKFTDAEKENGIVLGKGR